MNYEKDTIESKIINFIEQKNSATTSELAKSFNFSRQYIQRIVARLVQEKKFFKQGSTRNARYVSEKNLG